MIDKVDKEVGCDRKAWAQFYISRGLEVVESIIKEQKNRGKYCVGDTPTLADIFLIPQLYSSERFEIDVSKYPEISAIRERLEALPEFKKAHPSAQPDAE